jgi:putative transposase
MVLVKRATVVQWHRQGFRLYWCWRSRPGRPQVDREVRYMIREMNRANPLWGAPRIHGELLKLGIEVSHATVAKYMARRAATLSPTFDPSKFGLRWTFQLMGWTRSTLSKRLLEGQDGNLDHP